MDDELIPKKHCKKQIKALDECIERKLGCYLEMFVLKSCLNLHEKSIKNILNSYEKEYKS